MISAHLRLQSLWIGAKGVCMKSYEISCLKNQSAFANLASFFYLNNQACQISGLVFSRCSNAAQTDMNRFCLGHFSNVFFFTLQGIHFGGLKSPRSPKEMGNNLFSLQFQSYVTKSRMYDYYGHRFVIKFKYLKAKFSKSGGGFRQWSKSYPVGLIPFKNFLVAG